MAIIVTGGLGFIGSNFVLRHLGKYDEQIIVIDNESYASNRRNLSVVANDKRVRAHKVDICDADKMGKIFKSYKPRMVYNFAAESHVDNSIASDDAFVQTNIVGTHNLLKFVREYDTNLIHVSTDEVYGSLPLEGVDKFTESTPYSPNNPYSATKAASDHLVRSYYRTHGVKAVVTNCSNNYGPRQHHEKFIPTIIRKAKANEKIPVYGDGKNIRDWLYVTDHCDALLKIASNFTPGERYNIGGHCELSNIVMTRFILDMMGKSHSLIEFVTDRPGHDSRYAISYRKLEMQLGWRPVTHLEIGLKKTLEWYNA